MRLWKWNIDFSRADKDSEKRSTGNTDVKRLLPELFGGTSLSGVNVTKKSVLSIPSVWSAVSTVSKTMASLPFALYQRTPNGMEPAYRHPCYHVTKNEPAPWMTGYKFRQALFARACLGDAIAEVVRNGIGRPKEFRILDNCVPMQLKDGSLVYSDWHEVYGYRVLFPYEVIHITPLTLDGMFGEDVVSTHRETFGTSMAATQYGAAFFGNGAHVSGVIEAPDSLDMTMIEKLRKSWNDRYAGVRKAGNTAVLDAGMKYNKIGSTPAEAGLTEIRTFQVRESARIFGVPLHLFADLGDTTFNNVETMSSQFVTLCLRPWSVQTEQELGLKTLTESERISEDYFYRFNLNGLLRGDTKTRSQFYKDLAGIGVLSPNDIRELEDLNAREGGDVYFMPMNMMGADPNAQQDPAANPQTDPSQQPDAAPV